MIPIGPERHVRTADLLRFVDGEGNAAFRDRVTAHLAGCERCTAVSAQLRADTARVLDRLSVLDETTALEKLPATFAELARRPGPSRASGRAPVSVVGWRRAATIILFLGVGAAIARPASAWLERMIDRKQSSENVAAVPSVSETPASAPVDTTSAGYSFTPGSNELHIDFAGAEPEAELAVRMHDGAVASFELQSTVGLPPVLILPNGLRIANGTNRGTHYDLALPRNVEVLIVSIAGNSPQRIIAGSLPARFRLNDGR